MRKKNHLTKITDFWIVPILIGICFSTGYEITKRNVIFKKSSNQGQNEFITNVSKSSKVDTGSENNRDNTASSKKIVNFAKETKGEDLKRSVKDSTQANKQKPEFPQDENNKTVEKKSKKLAKKSPNSLMNLQLPEKELVLHENETFIENLFKSLPEP